MLELSQIKKRKLDEIVNPILSKSARESEEAGLALSREANDFGLNLPDFLNLAVDLSEGKEAELHSNGLSGYEMVNMALNLPNKNDFRNQVVLAQASETFATNPGSRVLFPYTIDNVLRWKDRQASLETVDDLIAGSRTIRGTELIRLIAEDKADDRKTFDIPEGSRIPVRKVRMSDRSVKIYKHGSGMEFTYEFMRRSAIDLVTPFAARIERDLQSSKMAACTNIMINGDGEVGAATAVTQQGSTLTYEGIVALATQAIKDKNPIDTLAGDIDAYWQFVKIFGAYANGASEADVMASKGGPALTLGRNIFLPIKFVLNSHVPAGKILAFNKAETIEEVVEAGSRIEEEETAVRNQIVTYVRTENTGYSLIYPKTRYLLTYKND